MATPMRNSGTTRTATTAWFALAASLLVVSCIGTGTDVGNPGAFDSDTMPPPPDSGTGQDASAESDATGASDAGSIQDADMTDTAQPTDATSDTDLHDTVDPDIAPDAVTPDADVVDSDAADSTDDTAVLDTDDGLDTGDGLDADPGDTFNDATVDVIDDVDSDSSIVPDPYEGRPAGQCVGSLDCPGDFTFCADNAPGGICNGCTPGGTDCPVGTQCGEFGACQRDCETVTDCPLGLTCSSGGVCILLRCVAGICPVPQFTCSESGLCNRATCSPDSPCPSGTTCVDALCVENNLLD
jgi:hypothetical protein